MRVNGFWGVIDLVAATPDEKQMLATLAIPCDPAMADGVPAGEEKAVLQVYMENSAFLMQNFSPSSKRLR